MSAEHCTFVVEQHVLMHLLLAVIVRLELSLLLVHEMLLFLELDLLLQIVLAVVVRVVVQVQVLIIHLLHELRVRTAVLDRVKGCSLVLAGVVIVITARPSSLWHQFLILLDDALRELPA